jgi:hypothetical protein
MKQPVKERIGKLREELAHIRVENSLYLQEGEKLSAQGIKGGGFKDCGRFSES